MDEGRVSMKRRKEGRKEREIRNDRGRIEKSREIDR